jgi:hypothetical protein
MNDANHIWTPRDTKRLQAQRKEHTWTPKQIADILKISPAQVRALLKSGVLKGFFLNGKWYVEQDELVAYLERTV